MISVVIVTWNCERVITDCLKSLEQYLPNSEVIIVDSNSQDKTCKVIEDLKQGNIRLIKLNENVGFSKGNNIGVSYAKNENILLLNPDTVLIKPGLEKIVGYLNDKIGLIGCKLLNQDYSLQPSCYMFDTPINIVIEQFQIGRFFPDKYKKRFSPYLGDHNKKLYVDWVIGAFMIISKDLYDKVEGFSEDYFLYSEDMDLCYKVSQKGMKVLFTPDYEIIHIGGQSEANDSNTSNKFKKMLDSRLVFSKKYNHRRNMRTFLLSYTIKLFIFSILRFITQNNKQVQSKYNKYKNYRIYIKHILSE
ncbi:MULTISPECIES: glycosyltransferase family 2 protein [Pontibacillus]|uniref:Glycosyltransferase family 2 protein n=1 Tax=Pontibacillus chungwhensis TaxID=265426 RepID=A0ABY8UZ37_9BACI|nr:MULTISPECIES: glycosyltransferase family 2 protein [Pontibacillus]MCD5324129.1 glycosyltransferase family 2 protein [Pontibacillus sp. HN14]WIF97814.1 glycosyltransferase family 2 protein [Pontibacillus chungwhensis]